MTENSRIALVIILALSIFPIARIDAYTPSSYTLTLYEDSNPSDAVINLGDAITARAETDDTDVNQVIFIWIDPSNNVVRIEPVPLAGGIAEDTFNPNVAGSWTVEADFGNGTVLIERLNVGFMVLPEVPIGAIGIVASIFGTFAIMRMRRK